MGTTGALVLLLVGLSGALGQEDDIEVSVRVPIAVAENTTVKLTCNYDLHSMELYAVKWYRYRDEFYRFIPKELPAKSAFPPLGDKVDIDRSDQHNVILTNVGPAQTGRYRCEVTVDSTFITRIETGYMHVVRLPEGNVTALTEKPRYALGESLRGNCTAPPGAPPANITWTVNGLPINSSYVRYFSVGNLTDNRNMMYTVAGIEFELVPESFSNGRLTIVCRANVFELYNVRATLVLDEERPRLASVLGTRESSHNRSTASSMEGWFLALVIADVLLGNIR